MVWAQFGDALRAQRAQTGLSQRALAVRAGVSERTVRGIESGAVQRPQRDVARRLADSVGLDLSVLPDDGARLRIGVLGPLVVEAGTQPADVGPAKQQALLGLLALQPGVAVSVEGIIDALWGTKPPASAVNLVHTYSSRLRRALEAYEASVEVVSTRGGYRLLANAESLDLWRFNDLVERAAHAEDPQAAVDLCELALGCWRGPVLADLPAGVRQHPAAAAVERRRLAAVLAYADAALPVGRCDVERLRQLSDLESLHEGLHARLMLALAADGQQASALRVFDEIRRRLDEELGVAPGIELRDAQMRVLRGELGREEPAAETRIPAQLPAEVAGFVGRNQDLEQLDSMVEQASGMPIVSIVGAPGVGKTALAVRWARRVADRFTDGQLYVNLRGYDERSPMQPMEALARFLRALGVAPDHVPADEDEAAALFRTLLADRKVLVVLDNASSAQQVHPLLPGSEMCAVVVTSRDSLTGLTSAHGARRVHLDVLRPDEAHCLIAGIIGDARAAAESSGVAALARTCGYLPLALRVVGADLDAQPHAAAEAYAHDLSAAAEIAGGDAVRAAFDLSYERLEPDAQAAFCQLGLIPGPDFSADAIAALVGCSPLEARRLAARLVTASLLQAHASGRYRFHDLLRDYAARLTDDSPRARRQAALMRLYDHYLLSVNMATRVLYPHERRMVPTRPAANVPEGTWTPDTALAWLDNERSNLREAITQADELGLPEYAWRIVDALRGYIWGRGCAAEMLAACECALRAAEAHSERSAEAVMQDILGVIHYNLSDYPRAAECHSAALELHRRTGSASAEAAALGSLGRVLSQLGEPKQQLRCHELALEISQREGDKEGEALNLIYISIAHQELGQLSRAEEYANRAARLSAEIGDPILMTRASHCRGVGYWTRGNLHRAIEVLDDTLRMARALGLDHGEAATAVCLAEAYLDLGQLDHAEEFAKLGLMRGRAVGERRHEVGGLELLGRVYTCREEFASARPLFEEGLDLSARIRFPYGKVSILIGLARLERRSRRPEFARKYCSEAWNVLVKSGMSVLEAPTLVEYAWALLDLADIQEAARQATLALGLTRMRGQRLIEARALHVLGLTCAATGAQEVAGDHWREALTILTDIGTSEADEVRQLLGVR